MAPLCAKLYHVVNCFCIIMIASSMWPVSEAAVSPVGNRIWTSYTPNNNAVTVFSCTEPTNPVSDPSAPLESVCYIVCLDMSCQVYEHGRYSGIQIDSALQMDFLISPTGEAAFLFSDTQGLHLQVCKDYKCGSPTRTTLRTLNRLLSKPVIGVSLSVGQNFTWIVSFVEQTSSTTFQSVFFRCKRDVCAYNTEFIVSQWNATLENPTSPIFAKVDSFGHTIVGFQAFSSTSYWFEIWRCDLESVCQLKANKTLENGATSIRTNYGANSGTVLLLGPSTYMFDWSSGLYTASAQSDRLASRESSIEQFSSDWSSTPDGTPNISPISAQNPWVPISMPPSSEPSTATVNPEMSPVSMPSSSNVPDDPFNLSPSELSPDGGLPSVPEGLPGPSPEIPLPPLAVPVPDNAGLYWYISDFNLLVSSGPSIVGFQGGLSGSNRFPIFSLTYRASSSTDEAIKGYCESPSCFTPVIARKIDSNAAASAKGLAQTTIAKLPSNEFLVIVHTTAGSLKRLRYTRLDDTTPKEEGEFFLGVKPPTSKSSKWDVLGVVGVANAAIATFIVLLALTVFAIHITMNRQHDDNDPTNLDASRLSDKQRQVLSVYHTSLKAN